MTYQLIISALADSSRRAIIEMLRNQPRNVSGLAKMLPISRPAVSQHLKILTDAGLLTVAANGTSRFYKISPSGADDLRVYLDGLWGDALSAFQKHIEKTVKND